MEKRNDGKVRRSVEEWELILSRFKSSGLSQSSFCRREGIALSSFQKWEGRLKRRAPVGFTELPAPVEVSRRDIELELDLGDGLQIRIRRAC